MFPRMVGIALLVAAQAVGAATSSGVVTILEGRATVIRALSQFDTAEGMRLLGDDLVRTDKDTFLRIEYEDQTSIELGPDTRLQLNHPAARKRNNRPALYLLQGWLKVGSGKTAGSAKAAIASVGIDVLDLTGVMVIQADAASRAIFAEQGTARCVDRGAKELESRTLKQGDFLIAAQDRPVRLQSRPTAEFTAALPRPFRDTLPFRYDVFKDHPVSPKGMAPFTYADVEPWINAEPSVRRQFVSLWRREADNAAFRASLDRDLQKHPEWDPVLHPEKYEPSPPPHVSAPPVQPAAPPSAVSSATATTPPKEH